jgi:Xaa-Pro dipeptidase
MAGVEAVAPGKSLMNVVEACAKEAVRQELDLNFAAGRMGHGIGLHLAEPPSLTSDSMIFLQPGMTITLEPGVVGPSGVFIVEQNVVVTEDGVDILSNGPWQIWTV